MRNLGYRFQQYQGNEGVSFLLYSSQAESIELCLFDNENREQRFSMEKDENHIWSCWVPNVADGVKYGYRLSGGGCNPQKLMLDPYAKYVVGKPNLGSQPDCDWFLLNDGRDNAHLAPKGIIKKEIAFDWQGEKKPQIPWAETIIYELHVKGFTQLREDLPANIRGTYSALADPKILDYLQQLGITAVELLPVNFSISEPHLQQKGLTNYWGYNPLAMFALEPNYASTDNPELEFKQMVKALHQAGIEVILDVVFNHSAESEKNYPTFCQRGIDDRAYYWHNEQGEYLNWTGCGNLLNLKHPQGQGWILDCLRYWVEEYHIDGFRFDLATVLGREPYFNRTATLFAEIENDPILSQCKLIAEPWDLGEQGYQVGNFPSQFAEWNDRFRDDMCRFWLWKSGELGAFAQRFAGSSELFQHNGKPHRSINFITAHDGFTLQDLVSYNHKHNEDNGENNQDGRNQNYSYNHGVEGELDQITDLEQRTGGQKSRSFSKLALLSSLIFSNGTPMLLAGDEFGNSQYGNNNAYCQDNEISWLKWNKFDQDLFQQVKEMIALRKQISSLACNQWWTNDNVTWLNTNAEPMTVENWHNHDIKAFQIQLDELWLCLINAKAEKQVFSLPKGNWALPNVVERNNELKNRVVLEDLSFTLLRQI